MEFQTITYKRPARFKIPLIELAGLLAQRHSGRSLRDLQKEYRDKFGFDISIPTISRAIKRAEKAKP